MKKKTHEEYVKDLQEKNPNIEVVGEYVDAHTKILHRCRIDRYEWNVTPTKLLDNRGCPVCSGKKIGPAPEYRNSIWASEYKDYFSDFLSDAQMKSYTPRSNKYIYIPCKYCGQLQKVQPKQLLDSTSILNKCKCRKNIDNDKSEKILQYDDIERHYVVYMHIVPNGKRYVGITKNNPIGRWNNGMGYIDNKEFYNDICKYGWSNIDHCIIDSDLNRYDALLKENVLIEKYDLTNINKGYNKHLNEINQNDDSEDTEYFGTCVTTLRISGTLKTKLKQIARHEHKTLNGLITHFLVKAVNEYILSRDVF